MFLPVKWCAFVWLGAGHLLGRRHDALLMNFTCEQMFSGQARDSVSLPIERAQLDPA